MPNSAVPDRLPREAPEVSAVRSRALSLGPRRAVDADPGTLGDIAGTADQGHAGAEHRAVLQTLRSSLTLRERNVVRLRFEFDLTEADIGERIDVSQLQVSRILRHSVARLRTIPEVRS
jgi:RNA polymerase sigma-B factor